MTSFSTISSRSPLQQAERGAAKVLTSVYQQSTYAGRALLMAAKRFKNASAPTTPTAISTAISARDPPPSFQTIPIEIKQRVLLFVKPADVLALSAVSREWVAASGDDGWWKILYKNTTRAQAAERARPSRELQAFHRSIIRMRDGREPTKEEMEEYVVSTTIRRIPEIEQEDNSIDGSWKRGYLTDVGKLCLTCHAVTPDRELCPVSGWRVCSKCRSRRPGWTTVPLTRAKKEYQLTEEDLFLLDVSVNSINGRRSFLTKVVTDLQAVSYRKHGGPEGLAAKKEKSRAAGEKRKESRKRNVKDKNEALKAALAQYGLAYLSNTRLASEYIVEKDLLWRKVSLAEVVDITVKMHRIHDHSVYRDLVPNMDDDCYYDGMSHIDWQVNPIPNDAVYAAFNLYQTTLQEYRQLPADKQTAEMCACGEPLIRDLVRAKIQNVERGTYICVQQDPKLPTDHSSSVVGSTVHSVARSTILSSV
ncbi:hypothetical protein HDV00_006148 [Rhizophlyctis rosea]|nr:hypothetical protein HDV00_006148 [Rhizophlyctis rosea]